MSSPPPVPPDDIAAISILDDPVRRRLYEYVLRHGSEVSRDDAAKAAGISRNLAGFHLDRLATEGLLEVSYRRLTGRSGPGAGRPSKLYRSAGRDLAASVPPRRYELAAQILAAGVGKAGAGRVATALRESARAEGAALGAAARERCGPRASAARVREALLETLAENGYAPESDRGVVRFRNCPFHSLVREHRQLVCGMNLALVEGIVRGLDAAGALPRLAPQPGFCCVQVAVQRGKPR